MGRGNACVHGEFEGLYYVYWDNFSSEFEDFHGNIIVDYDLQREEWENSLSIFIKDFKSKYKTFEECDEWMNSTEHAILESPLFYIVEEDDENKIALKLIQKEQDDYSRGNIANLQGRFYKSYLKGMEQCLFNQFNELGIYGGPWTSGRIYKNQAS